jgi:hypothetical protein
MRAGVVVSVALALALVACEKDTRPAPFEPGLTIHLTRRKPQVHERVEQVQETSLESSIEKGGRSVPWRWHKHSEATFDVLAVDGFVVNRVLVTYKNVEESQELDGKRSASNDGRKGVTYVVWRDGGDLTTTYQEGGVPPDAERDDVLYDNDRVGLDDATEAILTEKTWTSGQKVVFTADELARVNDRPVHAGGEKRTTRSMELMLRSAKDGVATFTFGMVVERERDGIRQQVQMGGDLRVEIATGHWLEMRGTGSMTGTNAGLPVNGAFKTTQESRWIAPP